MTTPYGERDALLQVTSPRYQQGFGNSNNASVFIFKRTTTGTAPALPSVTATYTFATGAVASLNNSWTVGVPDASGGAYLWIALFHASAAANTVNILTTDWTAPQLQSQDGVTRYMWIKYGTSSAGAGLSDDPTGKSYLGVAYNKTTATASTDPADYTWTLIQGASGTPVQGDPGARGAGSYYVVGSSWTDAAANTATPGANVVDDIVTISNGTTFIMVKKWTVAGTWNPIGQVYDGGAIFPGTVTSNQINSNGLDIRRPDGTLILDAGGLTTGHEAPGTKNSDITLGVNMIPSNSLPSSTLTFNSSSSSGAYTWEGPFYAAPVDGFGVWSPGRCGSVWTHAMGTPPAGTYIDTYKDSSARYPVVAGRRYEFGISISAHRCTGRLHALWYDAAGAYIIEQAGSDIVGTAGSSTSNPVDFPRSILFVTAPAGAVTVLMKGLQLHNGAQTDPYCFYSQWYIGEAGASQTIPSKWTDSPVGLTAAATKAQSDASAAASQAALANAEIANVASDNILARGEKRAEYAKWEAIYAEYPGIYTQGTDFARTTERDAYSSAYSSLNTYLTGLGAEWYTIPGNNLAIVGTTYKSMFVNYYAARQTLLNAIATEAGKRAVWSTGISGRPADAELLNSYIKLGGTNLLRYSGQFKDGMPGWVTNGGTVTYDGVTTYGGFKTLRIDGGGGATNAYVMRLKPNTLYTASAMVKSNTALNENVSSRHIHVQVWTDELPSNVHQEGLIAWDQDLPLNTFKRVWVTFQTPNSTTLVYHRLFFYPLGTGIVFNVGYAKVEEGNKPSDWSAAPEDASVEIEAMISDNVLSKLEKSQTILLWDAIVYESNIYGAQANALAVDTASYTSAYNALSSYLGGITPQWNDLTTDSPIVGSTFRTYFKNYYTTKASLQNAISAAAATRANWVSGIAGRPADGELLNSAIIVGGANLYPDSGFERGTHPCTGGAGFGSSDPNHGGAYAGTKCLFFDGAAADFYVYLAGPLCPVKEGVQYVYSFMYSTSGAIVDDSGHGSSSFLHLSNGNHVPVPHPVAATYGAWVLCQVLWTCPAGVTTVDARFGLHTTGYSWMAVDCIQMEEGNKRTQWSPAKADIDADILIANTAASTAQTAATAANTALGNIFADNVLSRDEKTDLQLRWDTIASEKDLIGAQANSLGVSTTSYTAAFQSLYNYIVGLSPAWNDTSQDTIIIRADANAAWNNYYTAKVNLLNAIATETSRRAVWSTGISGRPTDAELLNSAIVVGGRNLYPDSGFERGTHPFSTRSGAVGSVNTGVQAGGYSGSRYLFFDTGGGDAYLYPEGPWATVIPGKIYTLSFYYKTATNGTINASSTFVHRSDGGHDFFPLPLLNTGQAWTLCEMPWTCPNLITGIQIRFGMNCTNYSWMAVDCIQIEEGNKRTQWAPAPEDIIATVSAISLGTDGTLTGAGGGQVTLSGMGLKNWRVISTGSGSTTHPANPGLYLNGTFLYGAVRSHMLAIINRADSAIVYFNTYDVYGVGATTGGRQAGNLAWDLNNRANSSHIVVVWTYDEPYSHRMDDGLPDAMYRCGASRAVFGSPNFKFWSAYILVGIGGCGEGNGAESYQGIGGSPNANIWCDMGFSIVNGNLTGVSTSYTPKTLADYNYVGDLNANYTTNTNQLADGAGLGSTALWGGVSGGGKPQDNATVGAPYGTNVGGTAAGTVESWAYNGALSYNAVTDATTGLNARMRINADNVLGGIISANVVGAPAGFRAGNITWDNNGNRTGGYGVAITPQGLVGYNSAGVLTFAVYAGTGAAIFAGTLQAATGSFAGALQAASGTFSGLLTASQVVTTSNLVDNSATDTALVSSTPVNISSGGLGSNASFTTLVTYSFTPLVTGIILVHGSFDVYNTISSSGGSTFVGPSTVRADTGGYTASDNMAVYSGTANNQSKFVGRWRLSVTAGVPTTVYFRAISSTSDNVTTTLSNIQMIVEIIKK